MNIAKLEPSLAQKPWKTLLGELPRKLAWTQQESRGE